MKKTEIATGFQPSQRLRLLQVFFAGPKSFLLFSIAYCLLPIACLYGGVIHPRVVENGVEFGYTGKANKVSIAGEFNNWSPSKDFLKYDSSREGWFIILALKPGRYEYKYLINGKWMEGANLVVEIKEKDGKLFIPEPKVPPPNTPYSSKINFGLRLTGITGVEKSEGVKDYRFIKSLGHMDLDWRFAATKHIWGFSRVEYDTTQDTQQPFFKQGSLNILFENFAGEGAELELFYKKKSVQFDNPLKITDRNVSLKYQEVEFYDELNPNRAFGLWEQGVVLKLNLFGGDFSAFYSDMLRPVTYFNTLEDNFGVRYFYDLKDLPFGFGITTKHSRGGWWPYANIDNHWFPNPESWDGYSSSQTLRNQAQPWYRGYTNEDFFGVDGRFYFLKGLDLFCEIAMKKAELKTERISGDIPHEKVWRLKNNNISVFGSRFSPINGFSVELSYKSEDIKSSPPLYQEEIPASRRTLSGAVRYNYEGFSIGLQRSKMSTQKIAKSIPLNIHPYSENLLYQGLFPYEFGWDQLVHAVESEDSFSPFVSVRGRRYSVGLRNKTRTLNLSPRAVISDIWMTNPFVNFRELIISEAIFDFSFGLFQNLFIESSVRYFYWNEKKSDLTKNFTNFYAALKYKFSKNFLVKLGYGFDPTGFDDDINADFDRRELFLYNDKSGDILISEDKLSKLNRIALRTEVRF